MSGDNYYREKVFFADKADAALMIGDRPEIFPADMLDWSIAFNSDETNVSLREWKEGKR